MWQIMEHHEKYVGKSCFKWCIIDLRGCYRDMGHGQYVVYSSKSSIFEECTIVFQAPARFPKNKDVSNTTFHYGKFWP